LKLDPSFHDARIAVGTYDYVVSVIPALLRWILRIGGSDKATGIRELEMGVAKGKLARTDGRMLLAVVYSREKRYNDALQVLNDLHGKYPRNFVFELSKGSVYEKMRQWDKAIQVYDQVLSKNTAKTDGYERLREEKIHYFIGNANVHRRQFDRAVESFHKVIAGANATPDEKAGSHLWIGKMLDSKKDRARAVQHYDAVLASKCDPELQAEARKYKRRAYGGV